MQRCALVGMLCTLVVTWNAATAATWPEAFRRDANLYSVCFVDRQVGWSVGAIAESM